MRYLVPLAILVLTACGKSEPGLTVVGFPAREDAIVRKAAADLFSRVPLDRGVTILAIHGGSEDGTEGGRACVDCGSCWIHINVDRPYEGEITGAVWHEFGHCVGLRHSDGVMAARNNGWFSWSADQIEKFVADVGDAQAD